MKLIDLISSPWAIIPSRLEEINTVYNSYLKGGFIDSKAIRESYGDELMQKTYEVKGDTAVIPIHGVLSKAPSIIERYLFGASSTSYIKTQIADAVNDEEVETILLHIDSPGGTVDGTAELANFIHAQRDKKKIIAYTDGSMASAAYWLGAAAHKIFISGETIQVGSIGVVATHHDHSEADKQMGVTVTDIYAGKYKRIASQNKPLSPEGREYIQSRVDYLYSIFVTEVAKFRGVSTETVLEKMADGKLFIGKQAIDAGLVDGVAPMDSLINTSKDGVSSDENISIDGVSIGQRPNEEEQMITADAIMKDHPAVYGEIREKIFKQVREEMAGDQDKLINEAVEKERARIKGVYELNDFGHSTLKSEALFDGVSTAGDVAIKINTAEGERNTQTADDLLEDAIDPVDTAEPEDARADRKDFESLVEEYALEHECSKSKAIKAIAESFPKLHQDFINKANGGE